MEENKDDQQTRTTLVVDQQNTARRQGVWETSRLQVEVESLCKQYKDTLAVDGLSFGVHGGEILGLVGPNGAGKTTTMRCICGIIPATSGRIKVGGMWLDEDPVGVKKQIAFVPAEPQFFDYLTVREHLYLFARLYESGDRIQETEHLLDLLQLKEKEHHLPSTLSRGMQQKLMIACALVHDPQVLIFDEPFTGLDPLAIRNIKLILKDSARSGKAVIVSSHLLGMVEEMVDRVLILRLGCRVAHATVPELLSLGTHLERAGLEDVFFYLTENKKDTEGQ